VKIRTKLMLFLPLLVVFTNAVAFFLFHNLNAAQQSYESTMNRTLLYNQIARSAESHVQALHAYFTNPTERNAQTAEETRADLAARRAQLELQPPGYADEAVRLGFLRIVDTLLSQSADAAGASLELQPEQALALYEPVERTLAYVQEDAQRLIDQELNAYVPIFARLQQQLAKLYDYGVSVFAINALLSVVLALWISRSVTAPVSRLVRMAADFAKGKRAERPPVRERTDDEFALLTDTFLRMQRDVVALMEAEKASLEKDRLVKELELQALQSQIHPHFLFNTLNVISKLSLLEGASRSSDLIVAVSNMLRYNLRRLDRPATLREEVEHVQQYIAIQRARFRDKIAFASDIDETLLDLPIPLLTIQPIVENAFVHGVEKKESGARIELRVRRVGDEAWITVEDNGIGMPPELASALRTMEYTPEGNVSGIGVRNVLKRLQLFTGRSDFADIRSAEGVGTTITLKLPLGKEENDDVPTVDRG